MQYVLKKDIKKYIEKQFSVIGEVEPFEQMLYYNIYSYIGVYEVGAIYNIKDENDATVTYKYAITQTYTLIKEKSDTVLIVSDFIFRKCFKSMLHERNKKIKKLLK